MLINSQVRREKETYWSGVGESLDTAKLMMYKIGSNNGYDTLVEEEVS